MKIKVDSGRCQGTGLCVAVAPDVLVIQADGTAAAIRDEVVADLLDDADEAVIACPVSALSLVRDGPRITAGRRRMSAASSIRSAQSRRGLGVGSAGRFARVRLT